VPPPGYEPLPPREDWGAPPPAPPPPAPPAAPGQIVPTTNLNAVQVRASLETLLSEPYIAIQRRLELANLLIGFEQANHYTLYNRHGQIVGYMAEENTSMSGTVMRQVRYAHFSPCSRYRLHLRARFAGWQLAKTHRPFTATIFDPAGSILMTVERPFYFVSTSLFVRDAYKNDMGEVHMNWYSTQEHCVVRVTL